MPYPFKIAAEVLQLALTSGKSIATMKRENEVRWRESDALDSGMQRLWHVMSDCIDPGMQREGILLGGLSVKRRAKGLHDALVAKRGVNLSAHTIKDWMSLYELAVKEENAAGGQVVTGRNNGAAGVVPAVLRYYLDQVPGASSSCVGEVLLTATAISGLVKHNASISGAGASCQAEVGRAFAMGAARFCTVMDGTPKQIENVAEIA